MTCIVEEKMTETKLQQEKNKAIERRRKHLLEMARKKEDALKENAKKKIERDEIRRTEQQRELKKEHDLRKAEKDILMAMKQDNLARIKRMQEYQQKETLRKVALNDKKSTEMKKQKAELLGEYKYLFFLHRCRHPRVHVNYRFVAIRKKNAVQAKIKKDKLMAVLDQARYNGGSSTQVTKLLKKLSSDEDATFQEHQTNELSKKNFNRDSDTVKTEQSVATCDIDPPPPVPSSVHMHLNNNVEKISEEYQSYDATTCKSTDSTRSTRHLRFEGPPNIDSKSL